MEEVQPQSINIPQVSLEESFKEHLNASNNHRILFSGPFGQGKTTFLNKVFEDEEKHYHTIKLYPVNYSVSSNDDVFQLIKFDIVRQLIGNYGDSLNLQQDDLTKLLKAQVFLKDNMSLSPWIDALLSCFGSIGQSSSKFFSVFRDTVKDFDAFSKSMQIDEISDLEEFISALTEKEGSAYEMDSISEQIKDLVGRLRVNSGRKIVLIIDDLDRLDPEHIFRLFNVFSTQFEYHGESVSGNGYNKFDFDKIIFVCDIENIRRIYRHKYGVGVDFKGYLDKFYSHIPFDFDNREFVRSHIRILIKRISENSNSNSGNWFISQTENFTDFHIIIQWLFISLIDNRALNLRSLLQVEEVLLNDIDIPVNHTRSNSSSYPVIILFQLLLCYYPSIEILKEKLEHLALIFNKAKNNKRSLGEVDSTWIYKYVTSLAIPFITNPKKLIANRLEENGQTFEYSEDLNCFIHFETDYSHNNRSTDIMFLKATKQEDLESEEIELNPYEVLSVTLFNLKKIGVLE
ncbi:P-loop NTPase fold protein [Sphingobacterium faecium]|uniref:P-loop NTPase fold protein n=1 Tax=Sphingobacterium faecium TaxID=34087 RepID=UPI003DA2614A